MPSSLCSSYSSQQLILAVQPDFILDPSHVEPKLDVDKYFIAAHRRVTLGDIASSGGYAILGILGQCDVGP